MRKFIDTFSKYGFFFFTIILVTISVRNYYNNPEDEGTKYLLIGSGFFGLNFAALVYNEQQSKKSK